MPATEQTWRSSKLLHQIFAVSSLIMLGATIWMFAKDHARPWKPYQRTANEVEMVLTDWRQLQFATDQAAAEHRKLVLAVEQARVQAIDWHLIDQFVGVLKADEATAEYARGVERLQSQVEELTAAAGTPEAEGKRTKILERLQGIVAGVRVQEDTALGTLKFARADRDAAVAAVGIALRDNQPDVMQARQIEVDRIKADVEEKQRIYDALKSQRETLQKIVQQITAAEDKADEELAKNESDLKQLRESNVDRRSTFIRWYGPIPLPGKRWLELPILDAFNSPRKIDNLWSDGLLIDYNFSKVRRFDRCTTCHQAIAQTTPGTASDPKFVHERLIDFVLLPPEPQPPADPAGPTGPATPSEAVTDPRQRLEQRSGLLLAQEGLLNPSDVTVEFIRPESPAARAEPVRELGPDVLTGAEIRDRMRHTQETVEVVLPGLRVGDVIAYIDGDEVRDPRRVLFRLLDAAEAGQSLRLTIRRGLPHPYASHPRLDLYLTSASPHPIADFACTICHEGQGSATAFQWASHTPDTEIQRQEWAREHGWFDNPHWIFPMYAQRFSEAVCLKCHHEVTALEPSERFRDPPAPKVVHGYHLLRKYGCYGCHEINGYDGDRRIGPDLRLEPNFFAAAQQLEADPGFSQLAPEIQAWTRELVEHPERDSVRHRLYEALLADSATGSPVLTATTHASIVPLLKDIENPGSLRRPGPSLRFVDRKLDPAFMFDWIREPKHFRPTTRMPQFFGLWDHLHHQGHGDVAEKFEPLEILGIVTYLRKRSQPFAYLPAVEGVEPASAERGKVLFQERGCLACHTHKDFPDTAAFRKQDEIVQGPDLSAIGTKFDPTRNPQGGKWLYSWIKQPSRYHVRTVMPDLFLTPLTDADGKVTDPAADMVAYLMTSVSDWQPAPGTLVGAGEADLAMLDQLVGDNLKEAFSEAASKRYAQQGIPPEMRIELKGAEVELLQDGVDAVVEGQLTTDAKLLYVGRRSLGRYGCYACHDIPGFEDAKPIGTTLTDWGRKDPSRLAFEHITEYLEGGHGAESSLRDDGETQEMRDFFQHQIESRHRAGFIYQKLAEPRSFDYHKTENKKYDERLRMPQFPLTAPERESVITFVLGLVADPPSAKYIFNPNPRTAAIMAGRQVLDKYNCGGCHILDTRRWRLAFDPGTFGEQPPANTFPFLATHFSPDAIDVSKGMDMSGLQRAMIQGMPTLNDFGMPLVYHRDDPGFELEDGEQFKLQELEYPLDLWQPTLLSGNVYEVGVLPLNVRATQIETQFDTEGGFLAKYLLPHVVQREKLVNTAAKGAEAWGWLPPPLVGEGQKVQSDWLHNFLLNPYPIRPAVLLRMPRFNMSGAEATQLVNYFAAIDNAEYPYLLSERQERNYLTAAEARYLQRVAGAGLPPSTRFTDAMNIVTNSNYCVKCHLVADFVPKGSDRAKAPNLAEVSQRLRTDYLRRWIANPKSVLPYTSMPVNIPYDPSATVFRATPESPILFHGTSIETVDALVDLLLNFDEYTKQRSLIAPLVGEAAPADATAAVVPSPVATPAPAVTSPPVPQPQPRPAPAATPPAPPRTAPAPAAAAAPVSAKPLPESLKNLPPATGWGHLKARFVYDGSAPRPSPIEVTKDQEYCGPFNLLDESLVVNSENGGVANVVATLYRGRDSTPMPIHPTYLEQARDRIVLDNDKCRFEPRVTLLWTPQTLALKNSDTIGHNTKIDTLQNPPINFTLPAGATLTQEFPQAERTPAAPVACSIHPWMNAWLVVRDNPYSAVSNQDGVLEIQNLPEGKWTIQFWHEKPGYVGDVNVGGKKTQWPRGRLDVTIKDGQTTDLGEVRFTP